MARAATFSRTDLTRKTREILEAVRRSGTAVIESYGEEQAVLLDPFDYRLLRALAGLSLHREDDDLPTALGHYLDEEISLGKVAELLEVSRYELMERFERVGIPVLVGPASVEDARSEVEAARTEV